MRLLHCSNTQVRKSNTGRESRVRSISMHQVAWLLMMAIPAAIGYGTGPPTSTNPQLCDTMLPGHGQSTASGTVPFAITVNKNKYFKAMPVEVTVYAKEPDTFFRGFFLQARMKDESTTSAIGSFISVPAKGTQFIRCDTQNSAWGHADRNKKTRVTATWMGPSSDVGDLVFKATVVGYKREEYWTSIMSTDITYGSADSVNSQSLLLSLMAVVACVIRM